MSTNNTSGNSGQGFTHRHPGWWRVLTLGFVIGGGLATAIFVTACPTDKWDEPDDDLAMRTSPVPGSPIDDLVDPSAATCQDGWRPLGLIEGIGGYTDMSVSADGVLALSAPGVVELWDVRAARKPAGLGTIKATELGASRLSPASSFLFRQRPTKKRERHCAGAATSALSIAMRRRRSPIFANGFGFTDSSMKWASG